MADSGTVLIVEDEAKLASLLADYLHTAGFTTHSLDRGDTVLAYVQATPPALILLDLMLPGKDGLEVCKEVRRVSHVPIIMVTARVEEIDRLLGLELGADDYVCKPYSPREIVARVKAILRRTGPSASPSPLHLDPERHTAHWQQNALDLTPLEFRLLRVLSETAGKVWPRDQLLNRLYDDHRVVTERTVDTHMKNLRRKLVIAGADEDVLTSIYGVGYKLMR